MGTVLVIVVPRSKRSFGALGTLADADGGDAKADGEDSEEDDRKWKGGERSALFARRSVNFRVLCRGSVDTLEDLELVDDQQQVAMRGLSGTSTIRCVLSLLSAWVSFVLFLSLCLVVRYLLMLSSGGFSCGCGCAASRVAQLR